MNRPAGIEKSNGILDLINNKRTYESGVRSVPWRRRRLMEGLPAAIVLSVCEAHGNVPTGSSSAVTPAVEPGRDRGFPRDGLNDTMRHVWWANSVSTDLKSTPLAVI